MTNTTKLEESKSKINKLRESQQELLQDDEDAFAEVVSKLSVKQIEEMTAEELLAFNNYEEDKWYINEPEFENQEELVEYIRSVMVYLIQSYEFSVEMDNKMKELEEITKAANKDIRSIYGLSEDTSSIDVIKTAIEKSLSEAEAKGDISTYNKLLTSKETFEETFTLDRIKNLYKNLNPENLKEDARTDRSVTIYKNYTKVQQKLGSSYDLIQVKDLETRFLPEEYHHLNNLFIIVVIKYISKSMKDGYYSSDTAFFVSQLTTNLFLLHLNKIPENYKEILLKNIKEFLDIMK